MNLSLVVLAAGASRRFGAANKLLQLLDGKPLLCHTLELAAALPVMQRAAVCSVETAPLAEAAGFTVLLNPQPELGQSHSLRLGLAACRESDGCLFLTGAIGCIPLCMGYAELAVPLALPFWAAGGLLAAQLLGAKRTGKPLRCWVKKHKMSPETVFLCSFALSAVGYVLALALLRWC